jgi:transcriptional regulator with XRE-family HTH domain
VDTTADHDGFGALLRAHRRAAGVSQRQLADRVGISLAAIRDLEQGRTRRPQPRHVDAIVTALNLGDEAAAAFRHAATNAPGARPARQIDPDQPLQVRILGPLTVHYGRTQIPVGHGRRRAVLARLALSANTPVPITDLIDLLWDNQPPPAPAHALQTFVSRLRSALQPARPGRPGIVTRTPAATNSPSPTTNSTWPPSATTEVRPAPPSRTGHWTYWTPPWHCGTATHSPTSRSYATTRSSPR